MKNILDYTTFVNEKLITEKFDEGQASSFDSQLKKWSQKYNVKYEWKFKQVRGKTQSYFILNLNYNKYSELPYDAKIELNGLLQQFHVDFHYSNKQWTPIIQ